MAVRFLTGDEQGQIKGLIYEDGKAQLKTLHTGSPSVQSLSVAVLGSQPIVAAAHSDGKISQFSYPEKDTLEFVQSWKETRWKRQQSFVGLAIADRGTYSCTSNGALRLNPLSTPEQNGAGRASTASLPARLRSWKLSGDQSSFCYGGDEVELSLWDAEKCFSGKSDEFTSPATSKKRKRDAQLFPAEIWRAKNVSNDNLGLRQPVQLTSIAFLSPTQRESIVVGTLAGQIRRYDTRAARRPVADWSSVAKAGGVKVVETGSYDHDLFVGDGASNILSLDLRNGRVAYGYKGISGAVTGLAISGDYLGSTALDRYARIHSTAPLPSRAGGQQEGRGEVFEKIYMTSTPKAIASLNRGATSDHLNPRVASSEPDDDDVWENMETIEEPGDAAARRKRKQGTA